VVDLVVGDGSAGDLVDGHIAEHAAEVGSVLKNFFFGVFVHIGACVEEASGGLVVIEEFFFEDALAGSEALRLSRLGRGVGLRLFVLVLFFCFFEKFFFYHGRVRLCGVLVCGLCFYGMDFFDRSALAELAGADRVDAMRDRCVFFRLVLGDDLLELGDGFGSFVDGFAVEVLRDAEREDSVLDFVLRSDGRLNGFGWREFGRLRSEALVLRKGFADWLFGALAVRAGATALVALATAVTTTSFAAVTTLATVVAGLRTAGLGGRLAAAKGFAGQDGTTVPRA
jgi:hypothetical protein